MAAFRISTVCNLFLRQRTCLQTSVAQNLLPGVRFMCSLQTQFDQAKEKLNTLEQDPDNEMKLKIYALFKQAEAGKATGTRPGAMNFIARAKWDAWDSLGDMSQEEAKTSYVSLVNQLAEGEASVPAEEERSSEVKQYETIIVKQDGPFRIIKLNRPKVFNAFDGQMYSDFEDALVEAVADTSTKLVALTGAGSFYSSGNDLNNFLGVKMEDRRSKAHFYFERFHRIMDHLIDFPKPLVAVVNGPAIGLAATSLGLMDVVYCSDKAYFYTPFTQLGQSAEGCSSYTFPKIMGPGLAAEMLIFNKKMSAKEAEQVGFVTRVYPHDKLDEVWVKLREYAELPPESLLYGKRLYRDCDRATLKAVNRREVDLCKWKVLTEESDRSVAAFFNRKS